MGGKEEIKDDNVAPLVMHTLRIARREKVSSEIPARAAGI
jgi:hypothetical protein